MKMVDSTDINNVTIFQNVDDNEDPAFNLFDFNSDENIAANNYEHNAQVKTFSHENAFLRQSIIFNLQ